jgi:hypothetical protein
MRAVVYIAILALMHPGMASAQRVVITPAPLTLNVDPTSNAASATLYLKNLTPRDTTLSLSAGEFVNRTTNERVNGGLTFVVAGETTGVPLLDVALPKGKTIAVKVEAARVAEAGESIAPLHVNGDSVGVIELLKFRVPFNVKIVAANADLPALAFRHNRRMQVQLRNDDSMAYRVQGAVTLRHHAAPLPETLLPPSSTVAIDFTPPTEWFGRLTGVLKDDSTSGVMTLRLASPGRASNATLPSKVVPITANLSRWDPTSRAALETGFIAVLLIIGGACSLLLRHWVPNSLRRTKLIEQLNELTEQTRALSKETASEIRVGVRVERQKLLDRLNSAFAFSPELPALMTDIGTRIEELKRHVRATHRLNALWEELDKQFKKREAVSKLVAIEDELRSISAALIRFPPELEAIEKRLDAVLPRLAELAGVDEEWVKVLEAKFGTLKEQREALQALCDSCAPLFAMWDRGWAAIKTEQYDLVDTYVSIIEMIDDRRAKLKDALAEKTDAALEFRAAVARGDYRAARKAMHEIDEGIYREHVKQALEDRERPPWIYVSQQPANAFSAIQFGVRFQDRTMDNAEALGAIRCTWDFGDGLQESCWHPMHYYSGSREPIQSTAKKSRWFGREPSDFPVRATFTHKGRPVAGADGKPIEIHQTVRVHPLPAGSKHRTRAEVVQLGIALGIALIGLLAGARDQIQKLDFTAAAIAIFLLGFSADAIKNGLAPASQPAAPPSVTP